MSIEEYLYQLGYEDVICFKDYDYRTAIIGVTTDNRLVYDFDKMVMYLVEEEDFDYDEAVEWIDYNTIGSLPHGDSNYPVIMYPMADENVWV